VFRTAKLGDKEGVDMRIVGNTFQYTKGYISRMYWGTKPSYEFDYLGIHVINSFEHRKIYNRADDFDWSWFWDEERRRIVHVNMRCSL
jgi:hypothetical protein